MALFIALLFVPIATVATRYHYIWLPWFSRSPEAVVALILGILAIILTWQQIKEIAEARVLTIYTDFEKRLLSQDQHDGRRFLYDTYSDPVGREKLAGLGFLSDEERSKVERVYKTFDALGNAVKRTRRLQRLVFSQYADVIIKCWTATETLIMEERRHQVASGQGRVFMRDFKDLYLKARRYCYLHNIDIQGFQILPPPSQRYSKYWDLANRPPHPDLPAMLLSNYIFSLKLFFDSDTGAVCERRRDDGTPPFLYSEATGYAIQSLLQLRHLTEDESFLDKALQGASWLISKASNQEGWIRTRYYFKIDSDEAFSDYSFSGGRIFTFDNAICLSALVDLYKEVHSKVLYDAIGKLAENFLKIADQHQNREYMGYLPAILDKNGHPLPSEKARWSRRPGPYQSKIAEALAKTALCLEQWKSEGLSERLMKVAVQICQAVVRDQDDSCDRSIDTIEPISPLNMHALCYAADGLLATAIELSKCREGEGNYSKDIKEFYETAFTVVRRLIGKTKDGYVEQEIGQGSGSTTLKRYHRTDAMATLLKLGTVLYEKPGPQWEELIRSPHCKKEWLSKLSEIAHFILSQQDHKNGYFQYGFYEDGTRAATLSFWVNMFAFDSLWNYVQFWIRNYTILVVLAGGKSTRLWPIAEDGVPKALTSFFAFPCLLGATLDRFNTTGCISKQNTAVALGKTQISPPIDLSAYFIERESGLEGTVAALRHGLRKFDKELIDNTILVVSTADNLIQPNHLFRTALQRAILTTANSEQDGITSLCIPSDACDSRFGNILYLVDRNHISSCIYEVSAFIEKPNWLQRMRLRAELTNKDTRVAWEGGCLVARMPYMLTLCSSEKQKNITTDILENGHVRKFAEPLTVSSGIQWTDAGVFSRDLYTYFRSQNLNTDTFENVILNNREERKTESVFLVGARRNLIITDIDKLTVTGISDHLIVSVIRQVNQENYIIAVVIPLKNCLKLGQIYRKLKRKWPFLFHADQKGILKRSTYFHRCKHIKTEIDKKVPLFVLAAHCHKLTIKHLGYDGLLVEARG